MEITYYDKTGHPRIYLSVENDNSFYTWDGYAVAYLVEDKIYGWRGRHIGWHDDGVIYDLNGYRIGTTRERCPYSVYMEYAKYVKYVRYVKYARYASYSKPSYRSTYSNADLIQFISQNKI